MPLCFNCMKRYDKAFGVMFCSKKCYKANQRRTKPLRQWLKKNKGLLKEVTLY